MGETHKLEQQKINNIIGNNNFKENIRFLNLIKLLINYNETETYIINSNIITLVAVIFLVYDNFNDLLYV